MTDAQGRLRLDPTALRQKNGFEFTPVIHSYSATSAALEPWPTDKQSANIGN
jgi:hypothetical protein